MRHVFHALICLDVLLAAPILHASDVNAPALEEQIRQQQQQINSLEQRLQNLSTPSPDSGLAFMNRPSLFSTIQSDAARNREFHVFGRINADTTFASQSQRDEQIYGELQNSVGFRRARLGVEGVLYNDIHWKSEFDFAGGNIAFRDVFLAARNLPVLGEFRAGHFREPFSLEGAISSNVMTFMERSTINQFDPGRNWGIGLYNFTPNERMTIVFAAFRSATDNFGEVASNSNDVAYDVRITGLPWLIEDEDNYRLIHLGAAFSYRFPLNDIVSFSPKRELIVPDDSPPSPLTTPITINATDWQIYNIAWAMVMQNWSIQSEFSSAYINQIGGDPVFMYGCYIQTSYFLTGEHLRYDKRNGMFEHVIVKDPWLSSEPLRGTGAWEVAYRFDILDRSDSDMISSNDQNLGERIITHTVGLNWYLNDFTRIMFNYTYGLPQQIETGTSVAHLFGMRLAVFW